MPPPAFRHRPQHVAPPWAPPERPRPDDRRHQLLGRLDGELVQRPALHERRSMPTRHGRGVLHTGAIHGRGRVHPRRLPPGADERHRRLCGAARPARPLDMRHAHIYRRPPTQARLRDQCGVRGAPRLDPGWAAESDCGRTPPPAPRTVARYRATPDGGLRAVAVPRRTIARVACGPVPAPLRRKPRSRVEHQPLLAPRGGAPRSLAQAPRPARDHPDRRRTARTPEPDRHQLRAPEQHLALPCGRSGQPAPPCRRAAPQHRRPHRIPAAHGPAGHWSVAL